MKKTITPSFETQTIHSLKSNFEKLLAFEKEQNENEFQEFVTVKKISKWGNSFVIRLNKEELRLMNFEPSSPYKVISFKVSRSLPLAQNVNQNLEPAGFSLAPGDNKIINPINSTQNDTGGGSK